MSFRVRHKKLISQGRGFDVYIVGLDITVSVIDYIRVLDDNESMIEYLGSRHKFKTKE